VTRRCLYCGRRLRQPSPDGFGPTCRRNLLSPTPRAALPTPDESDLDHAALAAAGQLAIPVQPALPDLSTYQEAAQ
jgi:hypothetical protein